MFKEFIRNRRKALGLTLADIADATGVKPATVSRWESGEISNIKMNRLSALAKALKVRVSYLTFLSDSDVPGQDDMPEISIDEMFDGVDLSEFEGGVTPLATIPPYRRPVLGEVRAGIPITAIENVIGYEDLDPKQYKNFDEYFCLKLKGDSMEPRMHEGDIVVIHQQPTVENGDIAIILVNGEEATCKKVVVTGDGLMLMSFNPKYEPIIFSAEDVERLPVTIVGKVVEARLKF